MAPLPSARAKGRRTPVADINVTPLVDVMLVLLIIFMVTAPLMNSGVPVNLPDSRAKPLDQPQKSVQIVLDAQGKVYIDDQEVARAALPQRLAQIAASHAGSAANGNNEPQIFVRADRALDYGAVMAVMGELNAAGLNRIALVSTEGGAGAGH